MENKSIAVTAGVVASVIVLYCIYFDRKRRMDPNYRVKLAQRRKAQKQARGETTVFPDLRDNSAVLNFLLEEIKTGETKLGTGDNESAVIHLANAVAVCGSQANDLLKVLQKTLTPSMFSSLIELLPALSQQIADNPTGGSRAET